MATDARNVLVGKGDKVAGTVLRAPAGSVLPTDAKTAVGAAFADHGLIGSDGIKMKIEVSTESITDMNGDTVRTLATEHVVAIEVPFLEVNPRSLEAMFGANNVDIATEADGTLTKVRINSDEQPPSAWVINLKDGDSYTRVVVSLGTVTTPGELSFVGTSAILLPITINPMPDENGDKALIYKFTPSPAAPAAAPALSGASGE